MNDSASHIYMYRYFITINDNFSANIFFGVIIHIYFGIIPFRLRVSEMQCVCLYCSAKYKNA